MTLFERGCDVGSCITGKGRSRGFSTRFLHPPAGDMYRKEKAPALTSLNKQGAAFRARAEQSVDELERTIRRQRAPLLVLEPRNVTVYSFRLFFINYRNKTPFCAGSGKSRAFYVF